MVSKSTPSSNVEIVIQGDNIELARRSGATIITVSSSQRFQPGSAYWIDTVENILSNKDTYIAVFTSAASVVLFSNALKSAVHQATNIIKEVKVLGNTITGKEKKEAAAREAAKIASTERAAERKEATKLAIAEKKEATKLAIAQEKETTKIAIAEKAGERREATRIAKVKKAAMGKEGARIAKAKTIATKTNASPSRKS